MQSYRSNSRCSQVTKISEGFCTTTVKYSKFPRKVRMGGELNALILRLKLLKL